MRGFISSKVYQTEPPKTRTPVGPSLNVSSGSRTEELDVSISGPLLPPKAAVRADMPGSRVRVPQADLNACTTFPADRIVGAAGRSRPTAPFCPRRARNIAQELHRRRSERAEQRSARASQCRPDRFSERDHLELGSTDGLRLARRMNKARGRMPSKGLQHGPATVMHARKE